MSNFHIRSGFVFRAGILVAVALAPWLYHGCQPSLRTAAERGDAEAQFRYGNELLYGGGVSGDFDEGFKWIRKSAEQGYAPAQYSLGGAYLSGFGIRRDVTESAKWFRKAAEQGHFYAQHCFGLACAAGHGVPQDFAEAYKWACLAASSSVRECVQARDELARRMTPEQFADGKKRIAEFVAKKRGGQAASEFGISDSELLRRAAELGDAKAQFKLGAAYLDGGHGVPQDYTEAVKWFRKGMEQGDARSQGGLGVAYTYGHGVPEDVVEAYKWFQLAVAKGDKGSVEDRNNLIKSMTPEQIAEGQKRVAEFVAKKKGKPE
ncbi:MAG: tetratricopeptide repeat protein [Kiritimatiellaeota bacterium]|nr:tetratricopeptide repeat protein [Kiritimatiellota bacterium]